MSNQLIKKTIETLLIIQERDLRIMRCQTELTDIPLKKKAIEGTLVGAKQALEKAKEALKTKQVSVKQVEGEIEACRQQIAKYREQQSQIKSNEEYRVLNHEIENVQQKIKGHEDREIVLMESIELAQLDIDRAKGVLDQGESHIQDDMKKLDDRGANLQKEIDQLKNERDTMAKDIDQTWHSRYVRIIEHRKDASLVSVNNSGCGGCNMRLPAQVVQDAKKAENIVVCNFCGRLLYWAQ